MPKRTMPVTYVRRVRPRTGRYAFKKNIKKQRYRRNRRRSKIPYGMPSRRIVKLRYCESQQYASILTAGVWSLIYQSSLYDPLQSAGGHQPLYYDQLCTTFASYRVFGIKYRIIVSRLNDTGADTVLVVRTSGTTTPDSNSSTAREKRGSKYRVCPAGENKVISGYMSVRKTLGIKKVDLGNAIYQAKTNANPNTMAYLIIEVFNDNATTTTCTVSVDLTYYAEMFDPVEVMQS